MRALRCQATSLALVLAAPTAAHDVQSWTTFVAQGPVDGNLLVSAEVQSRLDQDMSHFAGWTVRFGVGVRLAHNVNVMAGYHFQHNDLGEGLTRDEHRAWEQVQVPVIRRANGFALINRWRLEQRSIVGAQDLGWRLRMQWRLVQPLHGSGSAGPVLQSETFVALNDTDWGAHAGLDSQRSFVGWLQPLGPNLSLEAGYLNIYQHRLAGNSDNHVLNITLNRRLG